MNGALLSKGGFFDFRPVGGTTLLDLEEWRNAIGRCSKYCPPKGAQSSTAIHISAMFDRQDENHAVLFVDPVDDSEIAPGCGVASFKFEPKRMANPMRIIGERSIDELDRSSGGLLGDPCEGPARRSSPVDLERRPPAPGHRRFARRTASSLDNRLDFPAAISASA